MSILDIFLHKCGTCCFVLSLWAVFQLTIMGIFYQMEVTQLLHDVEEVKYNSTEEFISKTKSNYHACARNCWIAAGIYLVMVLLSRICIMKANKNAKRFAAKQGDDEQFCSQKAALKKLKI